MLFKITCFVILSCKITGTRGRGIYVYRQRERTGLLCSTSP